jgi:hypothetical protein
MTLSLAQTDPIHRRQGTVLVKPVFKSAAFASRYQWSLNFEFIDAITIFRTFELKVSV